MDDELTLQTADGPMPAVVATPTGTAKGGVVVIQEAFGLTPHILSIARRLADAGWLAIAPALFHRSGSPVFEYETDFAKIGPIFQSLSAEGIAMDVDAAIAEVNGRGIALEHTGIVGFCMGGTVSFATAARVSLGAAVTFYGGGVAEGRFGMPSLVDLAPSLRAPWLGLYGDEDRGIPVEQVEALRTAVGRASVDTELVRYPGAEHGFNCDDRGSFHAEAAGDAWSRTLAWFDRYLA